MKINSNFIMKTLKNKLLIGAMATLGAFGNADAQNMEQSSDSLKQDDMKIVFTCEDENKNKIPCFDEYGNLKAYYLWGDATKKVSILYKKEGGEMFIFLVNYLQIENSNGEYIRYSGRRMDEAFYFVYNGEAPDILVPTGTMRYIRRDLTTGGYNHIDVPPEQKASEIFGEKFVERTIELVASVKDSLKLVNFLKEEYNGWKIIKDENGDMVEKKPKISNVFFQRAKSGMPE